MAIGGIGTNWAGVHTYRARELHAPESLDELRSIVARAPQVHALGSRHAFNDLADADELVSLERMPAGIALDREARTVTVSAGVRYGELALALQREGFALHTMASLPHISVAGAVATATHGSGDRNGNLATAVAALELVTSEGEVVHAARGDDDFAGMVVGIGALGVVTRFTLDVEPTYMVRQQVFDRLPWETVLARFDEVTAAADSVSLFTDYGDVVDETWLKERVDPVGAAPLRPDFLGAPAATADLHPVRRLDAASCTGQLGVPGPWHDRLPHFRMEGTPASGDEIQSEYMVPRVHAVAALRALRALHARMAPHLWIAEIRTVAADDLWLSTAYGADTVCLHFSWLRDAAEVARLLPLVEEALAPFRPRPHWAKVFQATARELEPRYERFAGFRALQRRLDPRGAFRTAYVERVIG